MIVARRKTMDTVFVYSMATLAIVMGVVRLLDKTPFPENMPIPVGVGIGGLAVLYGITLFALQLELIHYLFHHPRNYDITIVGSRSLLLKRRQEPFRVIQREDCVAYIPRRAALILKNGDAVCLPQPPLTCELSRIPEALFETWYSKEAWEKLRIAWHAANAPADGWVWGLAGAGGWAVLVAVTAWLVMGSVWAFAAVLGAAVLATLVALYFLRWKTPFVYALPPQYDVAESNTSAESKQNSTALPDH